MAIRIKEWWTPWRIGCTLIMLLSALVYVGCLGGAAVWDDHILLTGVGIGGGDSLLSCFIHPFLDHYYRPLVSVSFYLEHFLWGTRPLGYHITNILFHILATGFLMLLLREAFERRSVALAGGLLFAVQPVQVSAVAWIGGRTDSMCALLMTLFGYGVVYAARERGDRRYLALGGAVVAYMLALLTKEQMLPMALLVPLAFQCFPPRKGRNLPHTEWWAVLPFAVTVVLFLAMGYFLGMPRPAGSRHSLPDMALVAGWTLCYYTLTLFAPTARWMHTLSLGAFERLGIWSAAAGFGVLALACALFVRWRRRQPAGAWFMAWVLLAIGPVANFMPLPFLQVSPYRSGVAGLGAAALLGWGLVAAYRAMGGAKRVPDWLRVPAGGMPDRRPALLLSLLPLLLYTVWCGQLTAWGATCWTSDETIFKAMVHYDPDSSVARYTLASVYVDAHKDAQAVEQIQTILRQFFGRDWQSGDRILNLLHSNRKIRARVYQNQGSADDPRWWVALMYGQLGFCRMRMNLLPEATQAWRTGEAINPRDPDVNLGLGYMAFLGKDYKEAARRFRRTLSVDPDKTYAHIYLGYTYARLGQWAEAADEFAIWVNQDPKSAEACLAFADAQQRLGDVNGAQASLQEALRRAPSNTGAQSMMNEMNGMLSGSYASPQYGAGQYGAYPYGSTRYGSPQVVQRP